MTVALTERTEMADHGEPSLDTLFDMLERMPVPEGYKAEIVEGTVVMSPQRAVHWQIILALVEALRARFDRRQIHSDVRFDFPGGRHGFCPDVAVLEAGGEPPDRGRFDPADVRFVAEVTSRGTAHNDYGPKKDAYAAAGVPVYLIVDPYSGRCHVFTRPKEGAYRSELAVDFGEDVDLTTTPLALTIPTADFPRG